MKKKTTYILLTAIIIIGYIFLDNRYHFFYSPNATVGGEELNLVISDSVIFRQVDPRWGSDKLGNTEQELAGVGCTLCCLSMALNDFGIEMLPDELNSKLTEAGGFT
ncbi:MAG: hypothetical protein PF588_01070, partial [Candidatus Kapabacteria bacterium]|nr:hypothetical protein [Candidatus Kapabacteria bacterium]